MVKDIKKPKKVEFASALSGLLQVAQQTQPRESQSAEQIRERRRQIRRIKRRRKLLSENTFTKTNNDKVDQDKVVLLNKDHIKPEYNSTERKLVQIATKGIITLFETIMQYDTVTTKKSNSNIKSGGLLHTLKSKIDSSKTKNNDTTESQDFLSSNIDDLDTMALSDDEEIQYQSS